MNPIYLDYNASSPLRSEAFEAMRPWMTEDFGNPSSTHSAGQRARGAVEDARERLARLLHCKPTELVFTSGATESINLALRGSSAARKRLATSRAEHHAVLRTAEALGRAGAELDWWDTDGDGRLQERELKGGMLSVLHANNETGVLQDVAALAEQAHRQGTVFHCDAAQSFGKLPIDLSALAADLLSASAHKFGGPKGVGFLFVRAGLRLSPVASGGEQEGGHRAGTENVAGIVGMLRAAELAVAEQASESQRLGALRDRLEAGLLHELPDLSVNGQKASRIYNTLSIIVPGIESDLLIMRLDQEGILVSAGSACAAGSVEPSHVLKAMGLPDAAARSVLRFSLGRDSTPLGIDRAIQATVKAVKEIRKAGI